jgi:hypothetical protein
MHRSSPTSAAWCPRCLEPGSACEATACDRRSAPSCSGPTQPSSGASTQSPSFGRTRTTSRGGSGSRDACGALLGPRCGAGPGQCRYLHICHKLTQRPSRPMPARGFAERQAPCALPPSVYLFTTLCRKFVARCLLTVSHTCNDGHVGDLGSSGQVCACSRRALAFRVQGCDSSRQPECLVPGQHWEEVVRARLGYVRGRLAGLPRRARAHTQAPRPGASPKHVLQTYPPGRRGRDCKAVVGT